MRYQELTEEAPEKDIQNLIQNIALSLIASGKEQIHTQSLCNEIKNRTGIDIPYGVLMDILNQLPFIQDATADMVTLNTNSGEDNSEQDQQADDDEKISQWAQKGATDALGL